MEKKYYLSKSRYCNGLQCHKMLWLDEYKSNEKSEVNNDSVLDNGTEVGIVAKDLFGSHIDIKFNTNLQQMIDDTNKALKNKNTIITEASFNYENNFCSVDILVKNDNDFEIYEGITHFKLEILLYFAQGISLSKNNKILFNDTIEHIKYMF